MAKRFASVDEYIVSQPEANRPALERVRKAIRKALPQASEAIAYNMPAYSIGSATLLHFAGWKTHYALYAATRSVLGAFESELKPYEIEKGTIRFPFSQPVPTELIAHIAKFLACGTD